MRSFSIISYFVLLSGCANYQIPIETANLPTTTDATVLQIELSPILEIHQNHSERVEDDGAL